MSDTGPVVLWFILCLIEEITLTIVQHVINETCSEPFSILKQFILCLGIELASVVRRCFCSILTGPVDNAKTEQYCYSAMLVHLLYMI